MRETHHFSSIPLSCAQQEKETTTRRKIEQRQSLRDSEQYSYIMRVFLGFHIVWLPQYK